jgi:hypothetical protein
MSTPEREHEVARKTAADNKMNLRIIAKPIYAPKVPGSKYVLHQLGLHIIAIQPSLIFGRLIDRLE